MYNPNPPNRQPTAPVPIIPLKPKRLLMPQNDSHVDRSNRSINHQLDREKESPHLVGARNTRVDVDVLPGVVPLLPHLPNLGSAAALGPTVVVNYSHFTSQFQIKKRVECLDLPSLGQPPLAA